MFCINYVSTNKLLLLQFIDFQLFKIFYRVPSGPLKIVKPLDNQGVFYFQYLRYTVVTHFLSKKGQYTITKRNTQKNV